MNENLPRSYDKKQRETDGTNSDSNRKRKHNKFEKDNEFNKYKNNLDEMISDYKSRKYIILTIKKIKFTLMIVDSLFI